MSEEKPDFDPVEQSPTLSFIDAWRMPRDPFGPWVTEAARRYYDAHLTLERAARLVRSTPAEVEAVLKLVTLDEDLELLGDTPPPKTTWFLLAEATHDGLVAAVEALSEWMERRSPKEPPSRVVLEARHTAEGPSADERIATLDAKVFGHLAKKAKQYDVLSPKARKFLVDVAKRRRGGQPLTARQAAWAQSLLGELVDLGVVRADSPDGDQELCNAVLDVMASRAA